MKRETNNEMDLLLRQLGRRQDVFALDAEGHLDADELSAYAENMMPAKARSRYTEHLAECSRCRDLVVQLSASAGVVIAQQADKVSEPSGWRRFLASLISPMVLKYAAPALGLIVVGVIGLMVLRQKPAGNFVSQISNEQAKRPDVAEHVQPSPNTVFSVESPSPTTDSVNKETATKNVPQQSPAPAPRETPAEVETNAPVVKAPDTKPESQPAAAEPPSPSPAKLDAVNEEKRQQNKDAGGRKEEAEVKVAKAQESKNNFEVDGTAGKREAVSPATSRSRAAKSKPLTGDLAAAQGAIAPQSAPRDEAGRGDKDSNAETKAVAGRRFRKQGGIWIDTAYDSSQGTMNLARGSEAYRSVVADEPAIKTIADQLDGEIIVVWKGRTYRIR